MSVRRPMSSDTRLALASSVISTAIPGETVILDAAANGYFSLKGTGARIWDLLGDTTTEADIVATIVVEYDVDRVTCERDVRALLDELVERKLVVIAV